MRFSLSILRVTAEVARRYLPQSRIAGESELKWRCVRRARRRHRSLESFPVPPRSPSPGAATPDWVAVSGREVIAAWGSRSPSGPNPGASRRL